jgi:exosortase D (VPLPA-CTERM-specific)
MTFNDTLKRCKVQLLLAIPLLAVLYYRIIPDMVMDWYKDDNYSHGFLVPIIAGYFLWQRWPDLKDKLVKPSNLGLAVIVLGLLQLLLGWLSTEYFTMRSSLIVLLAGMILYWFGREMLKRMSLPLAYLIFMVPIPYIIYDMAAFPLKLFVTRVSVAFMKMVGVVVMREGNIIIFPATTLEVADACSGIRSLTSLLALAVAYAFFVQTSNVRRWIIIVSAVPIAIATNATRVIVTGILAQWWGAKAAEGFFHEFAGMAVFALAMSLLVAVGALVKGKSHAEGLESGQSETKDTGVIDNEQGTALESPLRLTRFIAVFTVLLAAALFLNTHAYKSPPTNQPFSQFPRQVADWKMTEQFEFSDNILKALNPTDYISRQYKRTDGATVSLYVGYHNGAKGGSGLHSPKHCLPGSGWLEVSTRKDALVTPTGNLNLVRAVYQKGGSKELFLYWFQMRDKTITDEYSLKLEEIKNSILYQRKDETFVRISVPFEQDEARATEQGEAFIRDFEKVIREFLPR